MPEDMVTDPQEVMGEESGEEMSMEMPNGEDLSEEMETPETSGGNSGFWPGPLGNTSPDESIDEVDGFRFGKEYIGKYLQRGFNKLTESSTTAGEDLLLASVNAILWLMGMSGEGENEEENEGEESVEESDSSGLTEKELIEGA